MSTPSPLVLTSRDLIFGLINAANPALLAPISDDNVTLSAPTAAADGAARNTTLTLTPKAGKGYTGAPRQVAYNRLDIAADVFTPKAPGGVLLLDANYATVADVLPAIKRAYGVNLQPTDLTAPDTALPAEYPKTVTVAIATTCLAYTGSFSFTVDEVHIALTELQLVTDLPGLILPQAG